MKALYSDYLFYFLPSGYRIKSFAINIFVKVFSILISVFIYHQANQYIKIQTNNSEEIALVTILIITISIILPLQEMIELWLKKKFLSEYLFEDPLSLKNARRKFDLQSLATNVFPDMVKISGSRSGRLGILTNHHNTFEIYTFTRGKQRKVSTKGMSFEEDFLNYLKSKKQGISIAESVLSEKINEPFTQLKADYIIPFIFRDKLFGFLAISNIPGLDELINLNILCSKAAISVYNHILTSQVAINKKYKREMEIANKIEGNIFSPKIPIFTNWHFETIQEDTSILLEFFTKDNIEYHLILLKVKGMKLGSGLVSSFLLGTLYSQSLLKRKHDIPSIRKLIDSTLKNISWVEDYEGIIATFHKDNEEVLFFQFGVNFKIVTEREPTKNLISVGWRYPIEIKSEPIFIVYKNDKVLLIKRK